MQNLAEPRTRLNVVCPYYTMFPLEFPPVLGHRVREGRVGRVHVEGNDRSFTLVEGTPTENLHLAFPAADEATVDEFHRTAVGAGYRDNGPPGERPEYHAGYHAAFVLDPAGTNVEAVCHPP